MSDNTTKVIGALDNLINRIDPEEVFGMYADLRDYSECEVSRPVLVLTQEEAEALLELIDNPPKVSQKLLDAAKRYKEGRE